MKKPLLITCNSKYEYERAVSLLLAFGQKHYNDLTDARLITDKTWPTYKGIILEQTFCGSHHTYENGNITYSYADNLHAILDYLYSPTNIEIKLYKEYTAIVSKEHVKVGCQIISHEKVLEIAEAIKRITS